MISPHLCLSFPSFTFIFDYNFETWLFIVPSINWHFFLFGFSYFSKSYIKTSRAEIIAHSVFDSFMALDSVRHKNQSINTYLFRFQSFKIGKLATGNKRQRVS